MDLAIVEDAVTPVRTALEADGYELHVLLSQDSGLVLRIEAGPEACEECLVPESVMRPMIAHVLADAGVEVPEWRLAYPAEH